MNGKKSFLGHFVLVCVLQLTAVICYAKQTAVYVALETKYGTIEIEVFSRKAPLSSESFLAYVDQGLLEKYGSFYRAVRHDNDHRLPKVTAIVGGVLDNDVMLPAIAHESTRQTGLSHKDGIVSLGRGAIGTAHGGLFFICIGDQPDLNYGGSRYADGQGFAAFGKVVKGMSVVRKILSMETGGKPGVEKSPLQYINPPLDFLKAYRKEI